ncbi:MAG: small subunit ribosomal protein S13 [Parcubacteria group bacterium LiPW_41]|nr:MAG: small subunit ribosomal protein S13 [Parcubacteria group bacterium LiPW_41]
MLFVKIKSTNNAKDKRTFLILNIMRIIGVNIPDNKTVEYALPYVYGIGKKTALDILKEAGVDLKKKAKDLTPEDISKIQGVLEKSFKVEGELRQIIRQNIGRMKEIKAYRGLRHARRLPVRGQRTKTNSRTVRGNVRKTAGSGKRKTELK